MMRTRVRANRKHMNLAAPRRWWGKETMFKEHIKVLGLLVHLGHMGPSISRQE